MLPNELGLVIFGPPGVGKTFAVQYAKEALSDKCADVVISGDSTNINALSDAFYGYGILNTDEHGTKSDFVFGGIVYALSDAVKNNKDAVNVIINEFNRSASMGKLDQILRDTGDTQTITIETMGDVDALRLKLKEQYGIEARAVGSSLVIDLNNVDGNGKKVAVFYTLIGNPGNERINAAQYGVAPIPAALSRRLRAIYVDYLDPQIDQKELISIFKNASSMKYLLDNFEREIRFLASYNEEDMIALDIKQFEDLLVESMVSLYTFFYNLYTNGQVDIVPAPTEIAGQFEYLKWPNTICPCWSIWTGVWQKSLGWTSRSTITSLVLRLLPIRPASMQRPCSTIPAPTKCCAQRISASRVTSMWRIV